MDATETQTMNTAQALANERSGQPCCNVATDVDRPNRPALLAQCRAISFWSAISASEVFRLTPVCKSGCCCCDLTALALPPSSRTRLRARSPWIGAASAVAAGFVAAEPAVAVVRLAFAVPLRLVFVARPVVARLPRRLCDPPLPAPSWRPPLRPSSSRPRRQPHYARLSLACHHSTRIPQTSHSARSHCRHCRF